MADDTPRWRRRKTARPGEILEAALAVFAETGFAAAKLSEIARRAGVSKAALYLYFETKEDLFRAVARSLVAPNLTAMAAALEASEAPFAELATAMLGGAARLLAEGRAPSIVREDVVEQMLGLVGGLILRAQARGEVVAGDPRLYAFSLMGPLVMGGLFRAVFGDEGTGAPDLPALAGQHARASLHGLLTEPPKETIP
jgi:AcrR family transcriptional regulator